ncbi:MAG: glycosyltransferase family 9 protein [Planctomycetota bacterium]|jgi:ADP-heptose:LPS heptosyltransferase
MEPKEDILSLLREKGNEAVRKLMRGLILQPGAIGDCILTLPLAKIMKEALVLGSVDIMGHTENTGIFPGRSCVDGIRSIDTVELHRLYMKAKDYEVSDGDSLVCAFRGYPWVVSFMGEPGSDFEQNLLYTVNCSHSGTVITLDFKAPYDYSKHLSEYYIDEFLKEVEEPKGSCIIDLGEQLLRPGRADAIEGEKILSDYGIKSYDKLVLIHPGSGALKKCWHVDNYVEIAQVLMEQGLEVVFLLGPAEMEKFGKERLSKIKKVGKCLSELNLTDVLEVLCCTEIYVGNDSGISHLAGALGLKSVVIFGVTEPTLYRPIGPKVKVIEAGKSFARWASKKMQGKVLEAVFKNV